MYAPITHLIKNVKFIFANKRIQNNPKLTEKSMEDDLMTISKFLNDKDYGILYVMDKIINSGTWLFEEDKYYFHYQYNVEEDMFKFVDNVSAADESVNVTVPEEVLSADCTEEDLGDFEDMDNPEFKDICEQLYNKIAENLRYELN